jgi:hypothetical protein
MPFSHFDPFSVRPKTRCTVGALRSEVSGHDVAIRSYETGRHHPKSGTTIDQLRPTA